MKNLEIVEYENSENQIKVKIFQSSLIYSRK